MAGHKKNWAETAQLLTKCLLSLEKAETKIYLKSLILPAIVACYVIDIVETYYIATADYHTGEVQLHAAHQGKIAFFEGLLGIIY